MKNIYFVLFLLLFLTGCTKSSYFNLKAPVSQKTEDRPSKTVTAQNHAPSNKKTTLTIVATLFPQYNFAQEIAGEKANVILLLPPGMESHSFEPTPGDIITIQNSDIFLYTGDEMEPWAAKITAGLNSQVLIANLSEGINLAKETGEEHQHEQEHQHNEEHHHSYNPHIWTSPVLAMEMVKNIEKALILADPGNQDYYEQNTLDYLSRLQKLDDTFRQLTENATHRTVYIGSRFSLYYFMEEYNLSYIAAYDSCEEEAEPSIKRVLSMIQGMRKDDISAIYYEELTEPYVAKTIAESANAEPLLFHSCHNVSQSELEQGATYLSLMEQNAKNLKKGLEP